MLVKITVFLVLVSLNLSCRSRQSIKVENSKETVTPKDQETDDVVPEPVIETPDPVAEPIKLTLSGTWESTCRQVPNLNGVAAYVQEELRFVGDNVEIKYETFSDDLCNIYSYREHWVKRYSAADQKVDFETTEYKIAVFSETELGFNNSIAAYGHTEWIAGQFYEIFDRDANNNDLPDSAHLEYQSYTLVNEILCVSEAVEDGNDGRSEDKRGDKMREGAACFKKLLS